MPPLVDIFGNATTKVDKKTLEILKKSQFLIALDGAFDILTKYAVQADMVLGDLDSITTKGKMLAQKTNIKMLYLPDQENTDFVKALLFCMKLGYNEINCYNLIGGKRTDHTIENLRSLHRLYSKKYKITLFGESQKMQYFQNTTIRIKGKINSDVAIISCRNDVFINSKDLAYDMKEKKLSVFGKDSVCNSLSNETAIIEIKGEAIIITATESKLEIIQKIIEII